MAHQALMVLPVYRDQNTTDLALEYVSRYCSEIRILMACNDVGYTTAVVSSSVVFVSAIVFYSDGGNGG